MINATTNSAEETKKLAVALSRIAAAGDVVLLSGDLGAGKTAFTQGYGVGLGVEAPITSPTFTLANQYQGTVLLHHLDVYRLDQLNEVVDVGLFDLLDEESVIVIEWGEAVVPVLPADYLRVSISFGEGDDDRIFEIDPVGRRWTARTRSLCELLGPWIEDLC